MPDQDGYPTTAELRRLRNWAGSLPEMIEYIRSLWWQPDWGFVYKYPSLELHTGGWSGNESIIGALEDTFFWYVFWEKSERGGHYWFKLTEWPEGAHWGRIRKGKQ